MAHPPASAAAGRGPARRSPGPGWPRYVLRCFYRCACRGRGLPCLLLCLAPCLLLWLAPCLLLCLAPCLLLWLAAVFAAGVLTVATGPGLRCSSAERSCARPRWILLRTVPSLTPGTMSSMLGWVAPVIAIVSPSQPNPAVNHKMSISSIILSLIIVCLPRELQHPPTCARVFYLDSGGSWANIRHTQRGSLRPNPLKQEARSRHVSAAARRFTESCVTRQNFV